MDGHYENTKKSIDAMVKNTFVYSDQLGSRSRRSKLLICAGALIFEFDGKDVLGVLRINSQNYVQNGKWSHTTYEIGLASHVKAKVLAQDFEDGLYLPTEIWEGAFDILGKLFPETTNAVRERFIRASFPSAAKKFDEKKTVLEQDSKPVLDELIHAQQLKATANLEMLAAMKHCKQLEDAEQTQKEADEVMVRVNKFKELVATGCKDFRALQQALKE